MAGSKPCVALLGIPQDANSSFLRGASEAPARIREALRSPASNLSTESGLDLGDPERFEDAGDVAGPIEPAVQAILDHGRLPLVLGGDHSVTHRVVRAVAARHRPLDLLQFDAHPDLYDEFEGSRSSHACPFARILEEGLVRRLVQVGIRTMNAPQREQAARFGVEVIEMRAWDAGTPLAFDGDVYMSVDLDVLDPAHAPGVSHREPGGASTRQLLAAIGRVKGRVVGADLVEFNPRQDPYGWTGTVCSKLVKEIAARLLLPSG
jgi:agmatinase